VSGRRPRIIGIAQARMGSQRLPGKAMAMVAGRPLLAIHLERLMRARRLDAVILATVDDAANDPLAACAQALGVPAFRGDEHDVLDRFYRAAQAFDADLIVRTTADCPLIDPALIDDLVGYFANSDPPLDYAGLDMGYFPRGLDAEIVSMAALRCAWQEARDPAEREHVMPFLWRRPERFRLGAPPAPAALRPGAWRWCVDTAEDLQLARLLLEPLMAEKPDFGWRDGDRLMRSNPAWALINKDVAQKPV
jgi:spore coat polysaccharide biosynthesis protein SpsF